jgi:hypothetical protein
MTQPLENSLENSQKVKPKMPARWKIKLFSMLNPPQKYDFE